MNTKEEILHHMALAFFASAYSDQAEECDNPLHGEIMDQLPEVIDPATIHVALTLCHGIEGAHKVAIDALFNGLASIWAGDREYTPEMFGHYCAMQAMGHGVGLSDGGGDIVRDCVKIPYLDFGSYSLEIDYFIGGE